MEKILYDLMDWAGIEELVYSEASDPGRLLGEHVIKEGLLIQAFLPNAEKVSVKIGGELFPMEMADENGFFAVLLEDRKELVPYHFCITYTDGDNEEIVDPYSYQFHTAFTEEEVRKFGAGIYYDSYEKFGAHPAVEAGIAGVHGLGTRCNARQCCGRFQFLGRKAPPDEKTWPLRHLRDLYSGTEARCDL